MNSQQKRNALGFELLEDRQMLSATADVVILLDASQSSLTAQTSRFEFTAELVRILDQKLASRGIGGQPDEHHDNASDAEDLPEVPENRFAVIEWGGNSPHPSEPVVPNHTVHLWPDPANPSDDIPWTNAGDAADTIDNISGSGGEEDAWEAIHFAAGYDENGDEGFTAELDFRADAAVHFVVVTDGPHHDDGSPPELGPSLAHRRWDGTYFSATYEEILTSLQKEHLFDPANENQVSNAVVTFIAGANYDESSLDSFGAGGTYAGYDIFGADMNIQDIWDVDRREMVNQGTANNSTVFIYNADKEDATANPDDDSVTVLSNHEFYYGDAVMFTSHNSSGIEVPTALPTGINDDEVYYVINRVDELDASNVDIGDTFQIASSIGGTPIPISSSGQSGHTLKVFLPAEAVEVGDDFSSSVDTHYVIDSVLSDEDYDFIEFADGNPPGYPSGFNQDAYDGELYGYLTWASGGTYWDINPLFNAELDSPEVSVFMQAIATDIFGKVARQVSDFDGDLFAVDAYNLNPVVGDIGDVDLLLQKFGTSSSSSLARFDLDADGDVDEHDLIRLIVLFYYTRQGDATLDGVVDAIDMDDLGQHWQANVDSWAEGDFNGDGIVNASDLTDIGLNWLLEHP